MLCRRLIRHTLQRWRPLAHLLAQQPRVPVTGPRSRRLVSCVSTVRCSRSSEHMRLSLWQPIRRDQHVGLLVGRCSSRWHLQQPDNTPRQGELLPHLKGARRCPRLCHVDAVPFMGPLAVVFRAPLFNGQARWCPLPGTKHRTQLHPGSHAGGQRSPVVAVSCHLLAGQALIGVQRRHAQTGRRERDQEKIIPPTPPWARRAQGPKRTAVVLRPRGATGHTPTPFGFHATFRVGGGEGWRGCGGD